MRMRLTEETEEMKEIRLRKEGRELKVKLNEDQFILINDIERPVEDFNVKPAEIEVIAEELEEELKEEQVKKEIKNKKNKKPSRGNK